MLAENGATAARAEMRPIRRRDCSRMPPACTTQGARGAQGVPGMPRVPEPRGQRRQRQRQRAPAEGAEGAALR